MAVRRTGATSESLVARRHGLEFLAAEILPRMKHAIDVTLLRLRRPD